MKDVNWFQHTAAWRRLRFVFRFEHHRFGVSTHSRVEAAAPMPRKDAAKGCWFQHTAAWRRLQLTIGGEKIEIKVSTHSRVEAAAGDNKGLSLTSIKFQHTAAWRRLLQSQLALKPCQLRFNTQPRGGGCSRCFNRRYRHNGFNTQPRGGGCLFSMLLPFCALRFQHTAAWRRLLPIP